MMPEDFIPLLEQFLEQVSMRKVRARDGAKVVIEGPFCGQPPIGLLGVIESAGCTVKDDDLMIGWRLFPEDVGLNGDPVSSLTPPMSWRSAPRSSGCSGSRSASRRQRQPFRSLSHVNLRVGVGRSRR